MEFKLTLPDGTQSHHSIGSSSSDIPDDAASPRTLMCATTDVPTKRQVKERGGRRTNARRNNRGAGSGNYVRAVYADETYAMTVDPNVTEFTDSPRTDLWYYTDTPERLSQDPLFEGKKTKVTGGKRGPKPKGTTEFTITFPGKE